MSGHRVLIKSGPENRGRSARGTSHMASLEFPPETGLILRCTRKAVSAAKGSAESLDWKGPDVAKLEGNIKDFGL